MSDCGQTFFTRLIGMICIGIWVLHMPCTVLSAPGVLRGRIVADGLNVREMPSRESAVIDVLPKETEIEIHNHLNGWYEILLNHDIRGFVSDSPEYVAVTSSDVIEPANRSTEISGLKRQTRQIQSDIEKRQTEIRSFTDQEKSILANLGRMEKRINQTEDELASLQTEIRSIESRINEIDARRTDAMNQMALIEQQAAIRLRTLYKLSRLGSMHILASAETLSNFEHRKAMLDRILSHDQKLLNEFSDHHKVLTGLTDQLMRLQQDNADRNSLIQKKLDFLSAEKNRHNHLLAEIRSKKALEMRSIEALKQASVRLDKTLETLARDDTPDISPDNDQIRESDSGIRFASRKGKLQPPVSGKPVSQSDALFESGLNAAINRSGIHFLTDRGEPVRAVHSGRIVFSEWIKGFGNMVIIDHGEHYFSVYAHLTDFFRIKNDTVQGGDVIGTTGLTDLGSRSGVYFEIRKRAEPLDVRQWLQMEAGDG
ncbi:MAG: peptidoglycan DD-metalloendopeptidase family protein [Desulfatirhabdiaceae bacterium]